MRKEENMKKIAFLLIAGFVGFSAYADDCPGGFCHIRPAGGGDARARCAGKAEHADCHYNPANKAQCEYIYVSSSEPNVLSCAAFECDDGYLLWVRPNGQSQGICHKESDVIKTCKENGQCGSDCECKPNYIPTPRTGKPNGAYQECVCVPKQSVIPPVENCKTKYALEEVLHPGRTQCCIWQEETVPPLPVQWNEEEHKCECTDKTKELKDGKCVDREKPEETPDVEGDCRYTFRGVVTCNGKKVFKFKSFKLTAKQAKEWKLPSCKDGEEVTIEDQFAKDSAEFNKIVEEVCGKPNQYNGVPVPDDNGGDDNSFLDAQNRIDAFIRNANLNVSVWKNADGKFNTSRLASDLTAGVVLGTVGGIVSANVIKKKQLEKGYDALHCAIGGQKVADWGDQFTVGFRQY